MSEEIGTNVYIGGKLTRKQIEGIQEAAGECFNSWHEPDFDECAAKGEYAIYSGSTNYGQAEALVSYLLQQEIAFRRQSDAKYEFDAEAEYYDPERRVHNTNVPVNNDDEVTVPVRMLKDRLAAGKTLAEVVAEFDEQAWRPPAVQIVARKPRKKIAA